MQDKLTESTVVGNCDHVVRTTAPKVRVGPRQQETSRPELHVQEQDGRIKSIVITCACGEQVTVICDYDETPQ